ncbi:F0F1 ATP synthase subunit A [Cereibacter changlensis JA139]|uniref:ATP synthase subunit a n=2 Tax=Cereibacter changlensis TaxID=402884 RepID=A0A2T4JXG8_9RHOB|nr:F0F1 ATP synthase subunit A [Cereibacter changlensis]PTE22487.1 F0F1 ATP synthase subunit A [Cereibacter changlensis JA139]PZX48771.1 F-type H+-transporting ATPase subunit a [Cereibacter changlensis]
MDSPLQSEALFMAGPVPIMPAVVVTWAIMAVLVLGAILLKRRLALAPSKAQAAAELLVGTVDGQIRAVTGAAPEPYRAFVGTLFLYILVANWSSLIPGVTPPTATMETPAALAAMVFLSIIFFGIRKGGLRGFLRGFALPNPVMIPLNILESVTRSFSMFVRLFGNVVSGVFVIAIVGSLAALVVPIPLMVLDLLTGAVQAYIFAILSMVFITSAVEKGAAKPEES